MTPFQNQLRTKIHDYIKIVYRCSKAFPKDELYGATSQLRRAALSIMLNYVEGYARFKKGIKLHFYETSYGSLKESRYLVFFSESEGYMPKSVFLDLDARADEIGKMLWAEIEPLQKEC